MKNKKPFSPKEFKEIYSKVPRLCVDLIIKIPGKGIVLSLRSINPYKGKWHFPGGTVLYREKIVDAVKRVAREEAGISVKINKLLGYIEYPSEIKNGRDFGYTISMVFLCSSTETNLRPNAEASDIRIFKELPPGLIDEQREFLIKKASL